MGSLICQSQLYTEKKLSWFVGVLIFKFTQNNYILETKIELYIYKGWAYCSRNGLEVGLKRTYT